MREGMVGDVKGLHGCTTRSGEGMKSLNGDKVGGFVGFINLHPWYRVYQIKILIIYYN